MRKNKILLRINTYFSPLGISPHIIFNSLKGIPSYFYTYFQLKKQIAKSKKDFTIQRFYPLLADKYMESGIMKGHYFFQDLHFAKLIYSSNPTRHIDIGSRIDGFVAHVATFRPIEIFDIRPLHSAFENITFHQLDFMSNIPNQFIHCTDSISCLHAIEHFGLGRYGDTVDIDGHLKGFENIYKLLKPKGKFYFSTPIGHQRIEFNAHRVFNLSYLMKIFEPKYDIISFSYIDDNGDYFTNVNLTPAIINNNLGCEYGCGLFELIKK